MGKKGETRRYFSMEYKLSVVKRNIDGERKGTGVHKNCFFCLLPIDQFTLPGGNYLHIEKVGESGYSRETDIFIAELYGFRFCGMLKRCFAFNVSRDILLERF